MSNLNNVLYRLQLKQGTSANLALSTTYLIAGEPVFTTDTQQVAIGYDPATGGKNIDVSGIHRLSSTALVDMNTATATTLFTVPAGASCIITHVIVRKASTSLTTASYSFGFNSATYNNVIANVTHTELTGNTLYTVLIAKTGSTVGVAADNFKVIMNTLQGGAATTTIDVYGYLF